MFLLKTSILFRVMFKTIFCSLYLLFSGFSSDEGWVKVVREEKVMQELTEEDRSIWVVLAKVFGEERILVRFPESPQISLQNHQFKAMVPWQGGELSLVVDQKEFPAEKRLKKEKTFFYRDPESSLLIQEKVIETEGHIYKLSFKHHSESRAISKKFFHSFEVERTGDFKRKQSTT